MMAWLAGIGESSALPDGECRGNSCGKLPDDTRQGNRLFMLRDPPDWSPALAENRDCRVLFDGTLFNRSFLQSTFEANLSAEFNDADLVLQA